MPLNLDTYPHPQLRHTVRLKYICPIYGELITDYIFMTEEEHEDWTSYNRIIAAKMHEINELLYDGEEGIEEWESVDEIENTFYDSEILSDAVISLLKDGCVSVLNKVATEDEISIALLYLYSIRTQFSTNQVRKEIERLKFNPKAEIVDRILKAWNTSTRKSRKNGRITTKWSAMNLELVKLLSERDEQGVAELRKALDELNRKWGIKKETNSYRQAVILAKFLCDYPATKRLNAGFSKGMEILSAYFEIHTPSYKKRVLIPAADVFSTLSEPQRAFQEQIREPWREFIRKF